MRCLLVLAVVLAPVRAHADDVVDDVANDVAIGAAIGAGGQGDAGYGALELRFDAEWHGVQIGLGGRAVLEGGAFRSREWSRPIDAIAIVRQLEASLGPVSIAAGALAPSTIGHVTDGYRATLDDRARTGARIALTTRGGKNVRDGRELDLDATAELDDVLDPALVGGALAWQFVPTWGARIAIAIDPATERVAIEMGGTRRWERDDSRAEIGASLVTERWRSPDELSGPPDSPGPNELSTHFGVGTVGFASVAIDRAGVRWAIAGDVRAGNGTNGSAFGPLYRVERHRPTPSTASMSSDAMSRAILDDAQFGLGAGILGSMTSEVGWLSLGGRYRPGLGALATFSAGAPMGRRVQAGGWIAASARATAGATEVRAVWATHFYTSLQLARMYLDDTMGLRPAWSATVWFGAVSR